MNLRSLQLIICSFIATCSVPSHAQIYVCKDANGKTITSDAPIPECANRPLRELGKNGVQKREIPAPLTPEQRQQLKLDQEKKAAADAALKEQQQRDQRLRLQYSSENDIEMARNRVKESLQAQMNAAIARTAVLEKKFKDVEAEKAAYNKKVPPPDLCGVMKTQKLP